MELSERNTPTIAANQTIDFMLHLRGLSTARAPDLDVGMVYNKSNNIRELSLGQLVDYFETLGEKKFRAQQVYEWLWQKVTCL